LRVMILQHLYGLSDSQAEEQIKDRLSFQKFVQLDTHEAVPDETTIWSDHHRAGYGSARQINEILLRLHFAKRSR